MRAGAVGAVLTCCFALSLVCSARWCARRDAAADRIVGRAALRKQPTTNTMAPPKKDDKKADAPKDAKAAPAKKK